MLRKYFQRHVSKKLGIAAAEDNAHATLSKRSRDFISVDARARCDCHRRRDYNAAMSTRVPDYKEAVDHLPNGGMLVFEDVTWEEYEELLDELELRPGCRVTYNEG